jgi:hypothetical protein
MTETPFSCIPLMLVCALFAISLLPRSRGAYARFESRSMDDEAYQRWPTLMLVEKLPYLLDSSALASFTSEFERWLRLESRSDDQDLTGFTENVMAKQLSDFRSAEEVAKYFSDCDSDHNGNVEHLEYIICRGMYGSYIEPLDLNEYDVLESIVIYDYEQKLNDPNFRIPGVKYDEDGIIVD